MTDTGISQANVRHRDKARDQLGAAGASAKDAYGSLRTGAEELYAGGREHFQDGRQVIEEKVRERPILALTAAIGVGVLLGLLLRGPRTVYVRVPATTRP
ncbi:hypothetical protein DMC25_00680 [Caulobacter sp. D4A]|uniref:hypothetical protein n=1 Tax=unclassified Caulobacter TaxID=2648921 RepID=UPI000D739926|nr:MULTISPECIES: hypothetical protein [unclassified Caulobacter]PXA94752.1 hypothetical protein DMC18_05565 [Caulobacter sp. D5]PXA95481.1 hypothetical protein DMC25_00680 [Caulobacter sp. D4A]